MMEYIFSLENIRDMASLFWKIAGEETVFAFHGAMGVGKTTFIHSLCIEKGVKDVVGSPTFSIINEYSFCENNIVKKIFHIDLYRLQDEREARQAGVEECLYSDQICFVEWPEKAPEIFPKNTVHIYFDVTGTAERKLRIKRN